MKQLDPEVFDQLVSALEKYVARVEAKRPPVFGPVTDVSDTMLFNGLRAVQIIVELAVGLCIHRGLGEPSSYQDAFERLARAGLVEHPLAERLIDDARIYDACLREAADGSAVSRAEREALRKAAEHRSRLARQDRPGRPHQSWLGRAQRRIAKDGEYPLGVPRS